MVWKKISEDEEFEEEDSDDEDSEEVVDFLEQGFEIGSGRGFRRVNFKHSSISLESDTPVQNLERELQTVPANTHDKNRNEGVSYELNGNYQSGNYSGSGAGDYPEQIRTNVDTGPQPGISLGMGSRGGREILRDSNAIATNEYPNKQKSYDSVENQKQQEHKKRDNFF